MNKFVNESLDDVLKPRSDINPFEYLEYLIDNENNIVGFGYKDIDNGIEFWGHSNSSLSGYEGNGKQYASFEGTIKLEGNKYNVSIKGTEYYDDSIKYDEDGEEVYTSFDSKPTILDTFNYNYTLDNVNEIVDLLKELAE